MRTRVLFAAALALVTLALAAWTALRVSAARGAPARGLAWAVRDADGAVPELPVGAAGLPLAPGHVLHVDAAEAGAERLVALELELVPGGRQSSYADVRLTGERVEHRVYVVPGEPLAAYAGVRRRGREWEELARAELDRAVDAAAPLVLRLALAPGALAVSLDGAPLLDVRDPALGAVARAALWTDDAAVRAFSAELAGPGAPAEIGADFAGEHRARLARERARAAALHAALALLATFAYVSARRAGSVPLRRRLAATLAVLAPCAFPLALAAWVVALPGAVTAVLAAALAVPGLRIGLGLLGEHAPPAGAARRARGWLVAGVACALVGAAVARAAGQKAERAAERLREARAEAAVESAPFRLAEPIELDLGNALELPGVRRDLELTARIVLAPGSLLELRLRAPPGQNATGVAFCAGDVGRYGATFVREGGTDFEPLGRGSAAVPVGRELELVVRARDDELSARIDGREVAAARCADFAAGSGFLLAAAGRVRVEALALESLPPATPLPSPARARVLGGALALAGCALLALLAARLLRQPLFHAAESTAFVWLPLALLSVAGAEAGVAPVPLALAAGASALLLVLHPVTVRRAGGPGLARSGVLVLAGALLVALPAAFTLERARPPERPDGLDATEFPGPRLTPGIVAFEHPAIRRFNTWLRAHRLRDRAVPLAKPEGTVRVLCTGSSSTWGHGVPPESGLDYPTVLGGLLRERLPDVTVETVNGGVPGSNSARLLWFFEEVLLAHAPDVVTLSLTYNDTHHLTQLDEGPYLERITAPDHVHGPAERRAAAELAARGKRALARLLADFAGRGPPTLPLWDALDEPPGRAPPERFADALRAWARLCAERGVALVLVKEPVRDDAPLVWKEEFRAAIDAVAAEHGLTVVDPTPALAAGAGRELFMDDVHPTPAGHAVIARELADALIPLLRALDARRPAVGPR